jgi:predicted CoA-substrate-specific enzyme activase
VAWFMGIDIGSEAGKGVLTNDGKLYAYHILPSGFQYRDTAERLRDELTKGAGLSIGEIACVVATGQGAQSVTFADEKVDDIRSCARGIISVFPSVKTIIDVQGQSSRIVRTDEMGRVTDFVFSEKCAAGSGQFLQIISNVLRVNLNEIGEISLRSKSPVQFTTGCAVFWETEAISRISEGFSREDILAGLHMAMAKKVSSLTARVGLEMDCAISGGGGLDIGLVRSIEGELKVKLLVPENPRIITAFGAAIMAAEIC